MRSRLLPPAAALTIAFAFVGSIVASGCGTIDVGPPTGPPMGCNGSPSFFITDVWPKYLSTKPPGMGYGCGQNDCHDANTGHGYFRLQNPMEAAPDPNSPPSSWPDDWRFDYVNAARLLNCGDPLSSELLTVPEGKSIPHPPGDVVTDHAGAEQLFQDWAKAP